MTGTQVATKNDAAPAQNQVNTSFINSLQPAIARAIPKMLDADRMTRIAITLVRQSEMQAQKDGRPGNSLMRCTPDSFAGSLLTASALGLDPGLNGEAYLVPYKGECTLIVGYQGLTKLFWNHPLARYLDAQAVHENDEFDFAYGLDQFLRHKPATGNRGKVIAYWAAAKLSTGASRFLVLSPEEVAELRGGKTGANGQIKDPQRWMERKTVLRQVLKLVPKSVMLSAAMQVDEQRGSVLAARGLPSAIAEEGPLPALPPAFDDGAPPQQRVTGAEINGEPQDDDEQGYLPNDPDLQPEGASS